MTQMDHDIDALDAKIRNAIGEVKNLDNNLLEGLLDEIRPPGWTSSAEYVFALGLTEALIDHLVLARRATGRAGRRRAPSCDTLARRCHRPPAVDSSARPAEVIHRTYAPGR